MPKLMILTGENNPVLRAKSAEIRNIDSEIKKLAKEMLKTMNSAKGLGLAAPQVGKNIRLVIITLNYNTENEMIIPMINPEILEYGSQTLMAEEGCLSLPGIYEKIARAKEITVKFKDLNSNTHILNLQDLDAREVQHEIDHLDGILFIDRMEEEKAKTIIITHIP